MLRPWQGEGLAAGYPFCVAFAGGQHKWGRLKFEQRAMGKVLSPQAFAARRSFLTTRPVNFVSDLNDSFEVSQKMY